MLAEKIWGHLRLQVMPTPASTEHSRASLRGPLSPGTALEATSEAKLPDPAEKPLWSGL